ncbi:MAG: site-specific tyrosine recombinase XerD, partial [Frondihabitans sp.]|nr:site-specific tyrosine recombinase XerD [Frondihabitans sp.]
MPPRGRTKPRPPVQETVLMTHHWITLIALYLSAQGLAGAPLTTLTTRKQHLQHLARRIRLDPAQVTGQALVEYAASQPWARETARGRRSTFRSFFTWTQETGHTDENPALALARVKPGTPNPKPAPDRIYREALMKASPREALMLRLAAEMGLRRGEVAAVHSADLFEDMVGWSLTVHGKGQKDRVVPCPPGIVTALQRLPHGYAFPGDDNGHLSPRWVGKLATGLLEGEWTMHKLRHRFATMAY